MSTAVCVIWLLTSMTGAEPPGVAYAGEPAGLERQPGAERPVSATWPVAPRFWACPGCRLPEPLLYVDTNCMTRWYTIHNAGCVRQPYNYLVRFDYPWHSEFGCCGCPGFGMPAEAALRPLDILASPDDTRIGNDAANRPSAIRKVD